jgi:hypothetical protein
MRGQTLLRWACKGLGGILSLLAREADAGAQPDSVVLADIDFAIESLHWIKAKLTGEPLPEITGTPSWPHPERNHP